MTIPELRSKLIGLIEGTPFAGKTYLVGGAVRDHLMGLGDISDFDLTVELPGGGIRLARVLHKSLPPDSLRINQHFGTARLDFPGYAIDLNGTRKERYQKNSRFPRVSPGSLMDDIMRRDFTVNALLMEIFSGDILDLCGKGLADLEGGIIRTLRDPLTVLSEDPLRILRAIRFAARFGFRFAQDLEIALKTSAPLVKKLSRPAQKRELQLMRQDGHAARARQIMQDLGILPQLQ